MKLMPASRAFATMRDDVASSVGPPNIMVPRQIGEIFRPLRPRLRYCIEWVLVGGQHKHSGWGSSLRAKRSNPSLREESMDCFVALLPCANASRLSQAMTWESGGANPHSSIS